MAESQSMPKKPSKIVVLHASDSVSPSISKGREEREEEG